MQTRFLHTEGFRITAIFVAILMVILALFFLGIDTVFGKIVQYLLSLA